MKAHRHLGGSSDYDWGARGGAPKPRRPGATTRMNPLHRDGKANSVDIELSSNGSQTFSDQTDTQEERDRVQSSANYSDASDEHERDSHLFDDARGSSLHGAHLRLNNTPLSLRSALATKFTLTLLPTR